jgi:hypothetical protein
MKTKKIINEEKEMIGRMNFINQSKHNPHDERREEKKLECSLLSILYINKHHL